MTEETGPEREGREDEMRRRFREALERKQSAATARGGPAGSTDGGVGPSRNGKRQRQFRRKSGG